MDLALEIDTENQQQIQSKRIHDIMIQQKYRPEKSSRSWCLLIQNPKAIYQETKFTFTTLFPGFK